MTIQPHDLRIAAVRRKQVEALFKPWIYDLSDAEDSTELQHILLTQPGVEIYDSIHTQLVDLVRCRHPRSGLPPAEIEELVSGHLRGVSERDYGVWAYYPWSHRVVHILGETEFIEVRTNRNRYKLTPCEQSALAARRVGVVGLSVGHSVALTLAMERSAGELRIADFDRLELSNLNRIRTGVHNLELPKVYAVAREIAEIDPYLKIVCLPDGVTRNNCDTFLRGLDIVVDECDSLDIKVLLRQKARELRIPVIMDTSDRGMLDVERFDLEPQRAPFHGLIPEIAVESLSGLSTEAKIPFVLDIIGAQTMSRRMRASLVEINQTISTWPQLATAVAHGGAAAADAVRRILLGASIPSGRYYIDFESLVPDQQPQLLGSSLRAEKSLLTPEAMIAALVPLDTPHAEPAPAGSGVDEGLLCRIVSAAAAAPSGGNCQPWKWLGRHNTLYLFHDAARSSSLLDYEHGGAMVALGAAIENAVLAAHHEGIRIRVDLLPLATRPEIVARLLLNAETGSVEPSICDDLYSMIALRRTDRRLTERKAPGIAVLEALARSAETVQGAKVQWLTQESELDECGAILGAGDRIRLLTEELNRHLMSEIRWTRQEAAMTRDGISIEELELSASDVAALQICHDWPTLQLVRDWKLGANFEKFSVKSVASASAVGLLTLPRRDQASFLNAGRAVQRLWLAATQSHVALQPMTALPYLFARLSSGSGLGEAEAAALSELYPRYRRLFPTSGQTADVFLFRLSAATETEVRSLRRPLEEILVLERFRDSRRLFSTQPFLRDQQRLLEN